VFSIRPEGKPTLSAAMTPFPWSVALDASLDSARALMKEHDIRHLPVMSGGNLVGVVRQRDIEVVEATGGAALAVADVSRLDAFVVDIATPLEAVLEGMASRRIDAALVVKRGRLAGILTATDACRGFARFLRALFPEGGDSAA
jgi:acetoin utilization protein AcuB